MDGRTWKRSTSDPVTVDSRVPVFDPESGEEGYANVGWIRGCPRLFGPVVTLDRLFDSQGAEIERPKQAVLDREPKFA